MGPTLRVPVWSHLTGSARTLLRVPLSPVSRSILLTSTLCRRYGLSVSGTADLKMIDRLTYILSGVQPSGGFATSMACFWVIRANHTLEELPSAKVMKALGEALGLLPPGG